MLIPRQVDMILYLLNREDWCSTEELCAKFGLGKNTLQPELHRIQEELRDGLTLEIGRKGFRIRQLSGYAAEEVRDHVISYGENKSIDVRPASILLYLLYLRQSVTIRELSEVFYLSRSVVGRELKTIKRWLDQFEGLELLTFSNTGIRVIGTEKRKRVYCARISSIKIIRSTPLGDELSQQFTCVMETVSEIMEECLLRHHILITGADFRQIVRLLASSVLRSRMGFCREMEEIPGEIPEVVREIAAQVQSRLDFSLEEIEQWDLWEALEQSNRIEEPGTSDGPDLDHALKDRLYALDEEAARIMALPEGFQFKGRHYVLQYLDQLYRRYQNGNMSVNNLDADIVREYPLEVHIASRMFPRTFGGEITEETSAIALFLAANLRACKSRLSVLLVTNEHRAVIYQIFTAIRQFSYPSAGETAVIPGYAYKNDPEKFRDYEIKLTTEPEVLLMGPDFYYTPAILDKEEIYRLREHFRKAEETRSALRLMEMREKLPVESVTVTEKGLSLDQLLGKADGAFQTCHLMRDKVLFVCRMGPETEPHVARYRFKAPLSYQRMDIERLLYVQCREEDPLLIEQFDYISCLLKTL